MISYCQYNAIDLEENLLVAIFPLFVRYHQKRRRGQQRKRSSVEPLHDDAMRRLALFRLLGVAFGIFAV